MIRANDWFKADGFVVDWRSAKVQQGELRDIAHHMQNRSIQLIGSWRRLHKRSLLWSGLFQLACLPVKERRHNS
jgi:hypothetical protein